ncbi:MAG: 3-methyl-2-oxobutanoate hydroxymethyltransferase [Chloroflexi bacterium]|nr:3-methyl-2-oxobutanoate hydroxymethyltransferase [Chloroflexota bacterium]MDL1884591.1 3-methyl-2-oxobutanoate hydroxymethyltransferase [Anaerolineae bacterium CFX8]
MRVTIRDIQKMKTAGEAIPMLTAYDATSAYLGEASGVPMLLVGDSLGMVIQGHDSTLPVKLEHIIYHTQIVTRVTKHAMIVADMPFMTYNASLEQAMTNAGRLMQEGGANAVKLEGGEWIAPTIRQIVQAGIPVMAHIGLTPQSVYQFGGFRVQGREVESARHLLRDAAAVQDAGAFAVVLELVAAPLAQMITERLDIPTIGIGSGPHCAGQVQVFHDLLGLFPTFGPRHARQYTDAGAAVQAALTQYVEDVKTGRFPTMEQAFGMNEDILAAVRADGAEDHADR